MNFIFKVETKVILNLIIREDSELDYRLRSINIYISAHSKSSVTTFSSYFEIVKY